MKARQALWHRSRMVVLLTEVVSGINFSAINFGISHAHKFASMQYFSVHFNYFIENNHIIENVVKFTPHWTWLYPRLCPPLEGIFSH